MRIFKDNIYYDQTGTQILEGDLLKVYHYTYRKRKQYMYHVVVMEETKDGPVMSGKSHYADKPHYRIYACVDKETKIYKDAKIIDNKDWETKRMKIKIKKLGITN